eukprot:g5396.t1
MRCLTLEQLSRFRGDKPGSKIYLSIKGEVFDVSSSYYLYGPNGPYRAFAGREIARSLALFSLEEEDIGLAKIDDLDDEEQINLEEWIAKFRKRYKTVAQIKESRSGWIKFIPIASMAVSAFAIAVLIIRSK